MHKFIKTTSLSFLVLIAVLGIPALFLASSLVERCPNAASAQDNPCESQEMTLSVMETEAEESALLIDEYVVTIEYLETVVAAGGEEFVNVAIELDENNLPIWAIVHVRTRGGVEIYEVPDLSEERLYAADANLFPHVVGRTEDSEWLYIYYFVDGDLEDDWIPANQTTLLDEQIAELPVVDPEDLPERPDVVFSERANMTLLVSKKPSTAIPTLVPAATSGSPPTVVPPPATPSTGT